VVIVTTTQGSYGLDPVHTDGLNPEQRRHPDDSPLALPVRDAARTLGIGTTKLRELIASGRLRAVRIDRRLLVPRAAIEDFLQALDEEAPA
jgi:excisionase family DNA binding protein